MTADRAAADTLRDELARALARVSWPELTWEELTAETRSYCRGDVGWAVEGARRYADAKVAAVRERIARVEAECEKWERRAPDGFPIEPRAIDYAKRLRRALGQP